MDTRLLMLKATSVDRLYAVCIVHLVLCIILIVDLTPGNLPLVLGGVQLPSALQWAFASFNCMSIIGIVMASVGNLYLIVSHLEIYLWILAFSLIVDVAGLVVFFSTGTSCATNHSESSHTKATVSCGLASGGVIVVLSLLVAFKIAAIFVVGSARRAVRNKYSEELLPYLRNSFRSSLSEESAFGPEAYYAASYEAAAAPMTQVPRSLSFRASAVPAAYSSTAGDSWFVAANSAATVESMEQAWSTPPSAGFRR